MISSPSGDKSGMYAIMSSFSAVHAQDTIYFTPMTQVLFSMLETRFHNVY